jgi:hypothetical protein
MKKGLLFAVLGLFLCFGQASAGLYNLNPTEDAYVFGTTTYNVPNLSSGGGGYVSLLKFDVSGISGQTITAATLNLYQTSYVYFSSSVGTTAYYAQDGWTATSSSGIPTSIITGATTPIGSNPPTSTTSPFVTQYPNAWVTYNLLPLLQGSMLTDGVLSIAIHPTGSLTGNQNVFASSEASDSALRPYLSVTTAAAPVPIPAAVWLFGSGLVGLIGLRRRLKK